MTVLLRPLAYLLPVLLWLALLVGPASAHTTWCGTGNDRHPVAGYSVTRVSATLVWHGASGRWRWRHLLRIDARWWSGYSDGTYRVWCS